MVKLLALAALLAAGCEASLAGDGGGSNNGNVDANNGGGNADAPNTQIDAAPACANNRKVFLEFLGVTLTDAAASDAATNTARWLNTTSSAVPMWRAGGANRATQIQEVIDGVKSRLSSTPIQVVTTRPASGPYVMIVLGGASGQGGTVGTIYSYSTSFHDCGDLTKSDVGWVSDMPGESTSFVANLAVGAIGWGLGLNGTLTATDCMCGWTTTCDSSATACTLSASIASSIGVNSSETACPNQNPQNAVAAYSTGFCN